MFNFIEEISRQKFSNFFFTKGIRYSQRLIFFIEIIEVSFVFSHNVFSICKAKIESLTLRLKNPSIYQSYRVLLVKLRIFFKKAK